MKKYKLFLGSIGLCVLSVGITGCNNQQKAQENITQNSGQQQKIDNQETEEQSEATAEPEEEAVTFVEEGILYKITGDATVEVSGLEQDYDKEVLQIPEEITYEKQSYTVSSIGMDQIEKSNGTVKEIVIPDTVTERVVIKRSHFADYVKMYDRNEFVDATVEEEVEEYGLEDIFYIAYERQIANSGVDVKEPKNEDGVLYTQAFPYLEKVKFLGDTAPKMIKIEQYVFDKNLCCEVPAGKKEDYQAVMEEITLHQWKAYVQEENLFKSQNIMPDIMEEGEKEPEQLIFSTDTGVYLVKESAKSGTGKVALLKLTKAKTAYKAGKLVENTLESEIKNGKYTYTLTELETGAIKWSKVDDSTIVAILPDTIKKLWNNCLDSAVPYLFLPKNCQILDEDLFLEKGDMEFSNYFCYAAGVENLKNSPFITTIYSNASKDMKMDWDNGKKILVNETVEGASLKVPKTITIKVGEQKKINASFSEKQKETLGYEMIVTERYNISAQSDWKKKIEVSEDGIITAKKAGTYYCMVYSMESGKHEYVKVVVTK